jgi:outer membrane protein assembly factor BamD
MMFMRTRNIAFLFLAGLTVLVACGPKRPNLTTCEEYYQRGVQALEREKWLKAQENFEKITMNFPGCDLVDDAQYMLGETYYQQDKLIEAQFEYRRVVEDFRRSDRMEDAQFKMAMCSHKQALASALDQTSTQDAIFRFRQYLEDFPNGQWSSEARRLIVENRKKLAEKDFKTAQFYARQGYNEGALIYIDHVLAEYPDTGEWLERTRYLKATILERRGQNQEALSLLRSINAEVLPRRTQAKVRDAITRIQAQ